MSATSEEHCMSFDVLERVTNVVHAKLPKVNVFDSFRTGLYFYPLGKNVSRKIK